MLSLVVTLMLSAEPVLVVAPFEVGSAVPADANLGRAMQSLVEADLKAAGLQPRTEDDLDAKNWGKIKGATHVLFGTIAKLGGKMKVSARLVELPNVQVASASLDVGTWNGRQRITTTVLNAFKKPAPLRLDELQVDDALLRAWGDALAAVHDGDPIVAKQKVAEVVKRWPAFSPAKERLGQL